MFNHFFKERPEKLAADVVIDSGADPLEKLRENKSQKKKKKKSRLLTSECQILSSFLPLSSDLFSF